MKNVLILLLVVFNATNFCYSKSDQLSFLKIGENTYVRSFVNFETNKLDSIYLKINDDFSFKIENRLGIEMVGTWEENNGILIFTNQYPSDKFLLVNIVPLEIGCNGYLPSIINDDGIITQQFYLDANQNSYTSGDLLPYTELDTAGKVRICSIIGGHCSDWFEIPYKDCYRFVIRMNVNPNIYNGGIKKLYFKKKKNKLVFIESELSTK